MNNTKTKTKSYLFAAIGFLLTLALDQWTKYLASTILRRLESFSLISGVFELRYLENRGAAFGIMQNRQIVFVVGGIIILAVILYLYQKMPFTPHYRPLRICAVLLASGAVGNMIDRVKLDYVVDFFYFRLIDFLSEMCHTIVTENVSDTVPDKAFRTYTKRGTSRSCRT